MLQTEHSSSQFHRLKMVQALFDTEGQTKYCNVTKFARPSTNGHKDLHTLALIENYSKQ